MEWLRKVRATFVTKMHSSAVRICFCFSATVRRVSQVICFMAVRPSVRPSVRDRDMELVTRQSERPDHQQRLFQTFIEDVFNFSLLVYIAHLSFLDDALYKFTYLLTYLCLINRLWECHQIYKFCAVWHKR